MQQLMETIRAFQQAVAASIVDQDRFQVDLAASQASNVKLCRTNEELRRNLQHVREREVDERALPMLVRARPMPFFQAIMDTVIPATFMGPKVTFTGVEDPESHITAFHTQMMLSEGSNTLHCKLFMSTLSGTPLDWFVSLLDGHIASFDQFSTLFREQYIVNRAPPSVSYDLYDIRQYQGESLKDFLNRFGAQVVKLHTKDEDMKGLLPGPFSDSLIKCRPKRFCKIRRRVVAHIVAEGEVIEKRGSVGPVRPRGTGRPQYMRVHEATMEKKAPGTQPPYEARKPQTRARTRENVPTRHNFQVDLKELIVIPNVADRFKSPLKTDKRLRPSKNAWRKSHQTFSHSLHNCLALGFQLDKLVRSGFLKDNLQEPQGALTIMAPARDQGHEVPIHGEINTIVGGFSGGGCTAS